MTTIWSLPRDLVKEIVSRVPLKSMRAVQLTCKEWNTLSKSRSFAKMHIGKITGEGEIMMIAMMDYNLYLRSVVVNGDPSTEPKGKLTCLNEQVKISQIFHCEGLLLCVLKEDDTKAVVWNPYLGQTKWIESRYCRSSYGLEIFSYALGYENKKSCRSHKILRFIDKDYFLGPEEEQFLSFEIYDCDSCLWRTLDVTPHWRRWSDQRGVSLKGNTYWCALDRRNPPLPYEDHIVCFDFTSEREEKLAVLRKKEEANRYEIDIWITSKIEAEKVSWIKFLTVDTEPNSLITWESFFVVDEVKKVAMGFKEDRRRTFKIPDSMGFHIVVHADRNYRAHACSYVPSLVQIKQPAA